MLLLFLIKNFLCSELLVDDHNDYATEKDLTTFKETTEEKEVILLNKPNIQLLLKELNILNSTDENAENVKYVFHVYKSEPKNGNETRMVHVFLCEESDLEKINPQLVKSVTDEEEVNAFLKNVKDVHDEEAPKIVIREFTCPVISQLPIAMEPVYDYSLSNDEVNKIIELIRGTENFDSCYFLSYTNEIREGSPSFKQKQLLFEKANSVFYFRFYPHLGVKEKSFGDLKYKALPSFHENYDTDNFYIQLQDVFLVSLEKEFNTVFNEEEDFMFAKELYSHTFSTLEKHFEIMCDDNNDNFKVVINVLMFDSETNEIEGKEYVDVSVDIKMLNEENLKRFIKIDSDVEVEIKEDTPVITKETMAQELISMNLETKNSEEEEVTVINEANEEELNEHAIPVSRASTLSLEDKIELTLQDEEDIRVKSSSMVNNEDDEEKTALCTKVIDYGSMRTEEEKQLNFEDSLKTALKFAPYLTEEEKQQKFMNSDYQYTLSGDLHLQQQLELAEEIKKANLERELEEKAQQKKSIISSQIISSSRKQSASSSKISATQEVLLKNITSSVDTFVVNESSSQEVNPSLVILDASDFILTRFNFIVASVKKIITSKYQTIPVHQINLLIKSISNLYVDVEKNKDKEVVKEFYFMITEGLVCCKASLETVLEFIYLVDH